MGSLSKESVREAINRSSPPPEPTERNALRRMRNQVYGGDASRSAYKAYVIEQQTNGEPAVSFEEFRRQRSGKNSLRD